MQPIIKVLGDSSAAARTILTRVSRIHLDQSGTSLFSFVPQERDELGPRRVVDILRETATSEPLHLEGLDCDHVVVAYQARTRLMKVVCATANCFCMASPHSGASLCTTLGTTL